MTDLVKLKDLESWLAQKSHGFFGRGKPIWHSELGLAIREIELLRNKLGIAADAIKLISDMDVTGSLEFRAGEARANAREAKRRING